MTAPAPDSTPDSRTPQTAGQAAYEALQASAQRNHPEYPGISGVAWENIDRLEPLKQADWEAAATAAIAAAAPAPAGEGELSRLIGEAIGEASVCWEPMDCTGVFDQQRASRIVDRLLEAIGKRHEQPQAAPGADAAALRALLDRNHQLAWDSGLASERKRVAAEREELRMEALT